jgi:hypothetical protein
MSIAVDNENAAPDLSVWRVVLRRLSDGTRGVCIVMGVAWTTLTRTEPHAGKGRPGNVRRRCRMCGR